MTTLFTKELIPIFTYQDYLSATDRAAFLAAAVDEYTAGEDYAAALEADRYYVGENPALTGHKTELALGGGHTIDLTAAIRTPTGIFKRLIVQLVQSIWAYGVQLDDHALKARLGAGFDKTAEGISKKAALHGVCYGFWNYDRLQPFTALEYCPLRDERTGLDRAGVRFWQLEPERPQYVQLFEEDGWTEYRREDKSLVELSPKQPYKLRVRRDALAAEVVGGDNYGVLPVVAMYANEERKSELSRPIKSKIDLYDFILSGFGDSVMRTKVVYWLLQGFSGQADDMRGLLREIEQLGILAPTDSSTAAAQTVDLPFAAVQFALDKLEKDIYLDFMGMRLSEISGGSLTNVAIQTAQYNLNMKVSEFEWQAFRFVQQVLALMGVQTENIRFKKKSISNDREIMEMIYQCRSDIDLQTALELNPLVEPDAIPRILERRAREGL